MCNFLARIETRLQQTAASYRVRHVSQELAAAPGTSTNTRARCDPRAPGSGKLAGAFKKRQLSVDVSGISMSQMAEVAADDRTSPPLAPYHLLAHQPSSSPTIIRYMAGRNVRAERRR
jgi:hypothetical protein